MRTGKSYRCLFNGVITMKHFGIIALLLASCTTATINEDGLVMTPPEGLTETKPVKRVDSDFAKTLKDKTAPKLSRLSASCPAPVTEIEHGGTTFRFAAPTVCVKSILGEPICKAGFTVTSVTPDVSTSGGVTRNGRMFNIPIPVSGQGFDSRAFELLTPPASLPRAFPQVGDAMVVAHSKPVGYQPGTYFDGQTANQPIIKASVITADTEARICGATPFVNVTTLFRRAPFGDKSLTYKLEDFYRILPTLPSFEPYPGLSQDLTNYYSGSVGMQAWDNWGVNGHIPEDKRMSYGNYRAARQGERMLISLMNIPFEHRLVIMVSLAQDAIDSASAFMGGATYIANGGHNSGPHLAMVKWLGYLTGDNRFKQKGPITALTKRFGEQYHLEWGTNFYVPSHTVNYNAFWDGAWQTEPSPASKPVSQYNDSDKRKISYMLCCGALNWQAGYLALHILGELDPVGSETDRIIMQWIRQFRQPVNTTWNNALMSVGASDMRGWWGGGQPIVNWMWPYLGWQ